MRTWLKVIRDLRATRGRVLLMVLALAAGLTSLGTVLSMRSVLKQEMARNYLETVPASATFDLGERGPSPELLERVRERPEVEHAELRATRVGRWRRPGERWGRALVFVAPSWAEAKIARVRPSSGVREPELGQALVERDALRGMGLEQGDRFELALAPDRQVTVEIAGVVHDPALPPASTEQAAFVYLSPATLAQLDPGAELTELRVLVADDPLDARSVDAQVASLGRWLRPQVEVHEVRVPPPGEHPHEAPSQGVLLVFTIFSSLTVVLSGVLTASLLSVVLARQVREVGVMKTLGASAARIRLGNVGMLAIVSVLALLVSVGPTMVLARGGIDMVARLLNIDVATYMPEPHVPVVVVVVGLLLPLLTAAPIVLRASRISVRRALGEQGVVVPSPGRGRWLARAPRLIKAALVSAVRRPRRLVLTVGLLGVAGGLVVSATSVAAAWQGLVDRVPAERRYAVELRLATSPERVPAGAERWGVAAAALVEEGLPWSTTYPDGGHGSLQLVGRPSQTTLVEPRLRSGRMPSEPGEAVVNQLAAARMESPVVGGSLELVVEGQSHTWTVVGVVEEVAAPASVYVSDEDFVAASGESLRVLRVPPGVDIGGLPVVQAVPVELLATAMAEHVVVLIRSLLALAVLMAVVGVLALSSALSTSVLERTRELAVLRAVGARPPQIRGLVVVEALVAAVLSLPVVLLVAAPTSMLVGRTVGLLAFELPLPLVLDWSMYGIWSAVVLALAAIAALLPARAAGRLAIHEALSRV